MDDLHALNAAYPWFFAFWAFVFGACWGSFLNVVIYRVPAKKSVVSPGSHCYACGQPIAWHDNIPILSWFALRGKARCCGAPFSIRYALVEALVGGLFLWTWLAYGDHLGVTVAIWVFLALLVGGSFIDYDTQTLPDAFTVWGLVVGFVFSCVFPELQGQSGSGDPVMLEHLRAAVLSATGAVVGAGVILWVAMLAEAFLRKEAMGFGDVLFMGCIGAFIGWKGAIFAIFGGALLGTAVVIPLMLANALLGINLTPGKTGEIEAEGERPANDNGENNTPGTETQLGVGAAIPFGPWLALGAIAYVLGLKPMVDAYFDSMRAMIFSPL